MYHYSARQAHMEAKRQDLMRQAERARAVRAARGERTSWFARTKATRVRRPRAEVPRVRAAEQPS